MQSDIVAPPSDSKQEQPITSPPVMSQPVPAPQAAGAVEEQKPELAPVDPKAKPDPKQAESTPAEAEAQDAPEQPKHRGTPGPGIAIFWAVLLCGVFIGLAIYLTIQNA